MTLFESIILAIPTLTPVGLVKYFNHLVTSILSIDPVVCRTCSVVEVTRVVSGVCKFVFDAIFMNEGVVRIFVALSCEL